MARKLTGIHYFWIMVGIALHVVAIGGFVFFLLQNNSKPEVQTVYVAASTEAKPIIPTQPAKTQAKEITVVVPPPPPMPVPEPPPVIPVVVVAPPPPPPMPPPEKLAVPDMPAQAAAERLIRETFKVEYAKKDESLAKNLINLGMETNDDPVSRYVALREARDLAAIAGDMTTSFQAIGMIDKFYKVSVLDQKQEALEVAIKQVLPASFKVVAANVIAFTAELLDEDSYDNAVKLLKATGEVATKARNTAVLTQVQARIKEVEAQNKEYLLYKKAVDAEGPENALIVGKYLCFVKGKWETGLPHLAKGSDAALKSLAERDIAVPTDPTKQVELADGWWDAKAKARAAFWYKEAVDKATGLVKARAEKRIAEMEASMPAAVQKYTMLDLSKAATVCTAKSLEGGDGEVMLFPKWGETKFQDVPFNLIDPKNGTKNAVVVSGANARFPKQAFVACNASAKKIHLLGCVGGGAWSSGPVPNSISGIIRLHYANNTKEDHNLINGVHICDGFAVRATYPEVSGSKMAIQAISVGGRKQHVRYLEIVPKSQLPIKFIELKGNDAVSPMAVAITIEK